MPHEINLDSHKGCKYYFSENHTRFILTDIKSSETMTLEYKEYNHIIVILKGSLLIEYDEFVNTKFPEGEIVFVPAYSRSHIEAIEESRVLIGTFDMPDDICITKSMEMLWELRSKMEYKFASVPIKPPMQQYLDLLIMYIESGMQCAHLHEIKERELFLVLRWFYTNEEFVRLFYLIIGKALDFRTLVIKNYDKVKNIEELAKEIGMSRSNFDAKFKKVFGMPPKQWVLQRKARSIRYYISKPNVTISDVIRKYNFESFTHFNRFSRQQFGMTPSELMKAKEDNPEEPDKQ
ncbi:MAG: helix-turn-helix transcriptional regulator [Bacteroidales bacterium]|jgi:AraC-like DNA-binding protein|nr:helix-turn-helix transcriptional regulator [Bacteroidales bacterium]